MHRRGGQLWRPWRRGRESNGHVLVVSLGSCRRRGGGGPGHCGAREQAARILGLSVRGDAAVLQLVGRREASPGEAGAVSGGGALRKQ